MLLIKWFGENIKMNDIAQLTVNFIKCQLHSDTQMLSVTDDSQIEGVYNFSREQDVASITGKTILDSGKFEQSEYSGHFFVEQFGAEMRYRKQQYEISKICEAFDKNKIYYVLLKGAVIRELYPDPSMRTSSDIDILVKKEDIERAGIVIEKELGGQFMCRTAHDVSYTTQNDVHVELHYSLVEKTSPGSNVLENPWDNVIYGDGFQAGLTNEFFVYYHIAHMVKHFVNGGFGIRFILDLYLINQNMPYDKKVLDELYDNGGIKKFAHIATKLSNVWFGDDIGDESTSLMEDYILNSGLYGNLEQYVIINQIHSGNKSESIINRIFMPYNELIILYPKLENRRYMYPWYFTKRLFRIAFSDDRKKAVAELKLHSDMDEDKKQTVKNLLDMLDIH